MLRVFILFSILISSSLFAGSTVTGNVNSPDGGGSQSVKSDNTPTTRIESDIISLTPTGELPAEYGGAIARGVLKQTNRVAQEFSALASGSKLKYEKRGWMSTSNPKDDTTGILTYVSMQVILLSVVRIIMYIALFILLCKAGVQAYTGDIMGAVKIGIGVTILIVTVVTLEPLIDALAKTIS